MSGLTESIAHFVSGGIAVPEETARIVRTGFIDTIATTPDKPRSSTCQRETQS